MTPAQLREIDRRWEAGEPVTQGIVPELDPFAAFIAEIWSDLRSMTPFDHPISLESLALHPLVDTDLPRVMPLIQTMDRAYFDILRKRREEERKQAEAKAKARARARSSRPASRPSRRR